MIDAIYRVGLAVVDRYLNFITFFSLLLLILVFAFCWHQWRLIRAYSQFPTIHLEGKWLFALIMGRCPRDVPITSLIFQELVRQLKRFQEDGICVLWFFRPHVIIYNDTFIKIFSNETAAIGKGYLYNVIKDLFGNGLITSEEEIWKVHRKILNPAFSLGVLKGKMHIFNEKSSELADEIQAVVDIPTGDLLDILRQCTFSIMAESVLGLNMKDVKWGKKTRDFMVNIDKASELLTYRYAAFWLHWKFMLPFFPVGRTYLDLVHKIRSFTHEIIEEIKESTDVSQNDEILLDGEEEIRKSVAQILTKTHLQDPNFTIDDVQDHLITIMSAGFDTSSITLMWCFYLLGQHQQEQGKAFEEIMSVTPIGDVTYDKLGKLKYLDCILKETMRLYSVVPFYSRKLKASVQCGKYTFPKGTELTFSNFMLHRNPHIYHHPEKFDPERFADTSAVRPWALMSFAEGYRSCIGKKFAIMEMKVLLVHVLRRFKITAINKLDDNDLDWSVVLKPIKPPTVLFTNRVTSLIPNCF